MIHHLTRDARGSVTLLVAGGMVAMLGFTALAVDVGGVYLDARALQGVADAAALAAAGNPTTAQAVADGTARDNGWPAATVQVQQGSYARDASVPIASRFAVGGTQPDAARVTVTAEAPLRFAGGLFGKSGVTITRRATAMRVNQAAFSIGTRLASVQGGVANKLLSQLTGGTINLSAASYDALLGANVDLFATLDALRTRLNLTGARYDQVLATNITMPVLLGAIADALGQSGQGTAAAALNQIAATAAARPLQAGQLIDLGPLASRVTGSGTQIGLSAWNLAQAAIALAGGRQAAVDVGATVPGLAGTKLWFATGDRPANSPWLTVTGTNTAVVRTAQSRLYLTTSIGVTGLPVASVTLPLYVELGSAEARLSALSCPTNSTAQATLAVTPSVGHVSIRTVANPDTSLQNFNQPVTESPVALINALSLLNLPVLKVTADARIDLGGTNPQMLTFTRADVTAGTLRSVSTNDLASGVVASLLTRPGAVTVQLLVLPLGLDAVLALVKGPIMLLAPTLDGVLNTVTSLIGLRVGQADVRMNGIRCGQPMLVA